MQYQPSFLNTEQSLLVRTNREINANLVRPENLKDFVWGRKYAKNEKVFRFYLRPDYRSQNRKTCFQNHVSDARPSKISKHAHITKIEKATNFALTPEQAR